MERTHERDRLEIETKGNNEGSDSRKDFTSSLFSCFYFRAGNSWGELLPLGGFPFCLFWVCSFLSSDFLVISRLFFNLKGNQAGIFIGRTDAEASILWPPDAKN